MRASFENEKVSPDKVMYIVPNIGVKGTGHGDGMLDGTWLGSGVGVLVDTRVGALVGARVGALVGARVGCTVG